MYICRCAFMNGCSVLCFILLYPGRGHNNIVLSAEWCMTPPSPPPPPNYHNCMGLCQCALHLNSLVFSTSLNKKIYTGNLMHSVTSLITIWVSSALSLIGGVHIGAGYIVRLSSRGGGAILFVQTIFYLLNLCCAWGGGGGQHPLLHP